jgi:hypothetical protein
MKHYLAIAAGILVLALLPACGSDDGTGPIEDPPPPWPDPSAKENVLYYVQRAYSERNSPRYLQILDDGFTNFLSDADVNNGLPAQWDRQQEVEITDNLFSKTMVPDGNNPGHFLLLVKSIDMDVQYENGVTWSEVNPSSAPTETWYTTTVFYFFQITVLPEGATEDLTYYPDNNSKAQFTVRNAGTDSKPAWKLVEFRDLGSGTRATLLAASTQQTTWGKVKSLYR